MNAESAQTLAEFFSRVEFTSVPEPSPTLYSFLVGGGEGGKMETYGSLTIISKTNEEFALRLTGILGRTI